MAVYKFAKDDGSIVEAEYIGTEALNSEQVKTELISALELFGKPFTCEPVSAEMKEVYIVKFQDNSIGEFLVCIKQVTPGGRANLVDEQRIQQNAKYMKYAYKQVAVGKRVFLMGVYKRETVTVFCAWKITYPNSDAPISKQIKIMTIADAIKNGFAQQRKSRRGAEGDEYAFALRKDFFPQWFFNHSGKCLWKKIDLTEEQVEEQTEVNVEDKSLTTVDFEYIKQKIRMPRKHGEIKSRKPNYKRIQENKTAYGRAGERLVLKFEQDRLDSLGIDKLVRWVSEEDDTQGYDILSYEADDSEIHIEVKTSALGDSEMRFYLSKNEYDRMQTDPVYKIYYVFDTKTATPRLHILDVEKIRNGEITLETEVYLAHWIVTPLE